MDHFDLTSLPIELVDRVLFHIPRRSDLAALRLTSQTLNTISTPYYFATVPLYPEWDLDTGGGGLPFPGDVEYEPLYFANILGSDRLKRLVRKVEIYMCKPDCDHHPQDCMHQGWMPKPSMTPEWEDVYDRLPELPKLESVSLIFDRHGGSDDSMDDDMILHGYHERNTELDGLLCTLRGRPEQANNASHLPGNHIKDLSIRNMQLVSVSYDRQDGEHIPSSLASTLEGLRALRLSFVHEQPRGESGTVYKVTDCHEQWARFTSGWLEPAKHIRHLTLYSDLPTGWFPKVNFCSVHFAHLESLALGQFVFSDDRHFKWIADHSETLQEVYFDHCSILYQSGAGQKQDDWLDDQGYPKLGPGGGDLRYSMLPTDDDEHILTLESYATRWSDAFALFSRSLTNLRTFRFGTSSQWQFGTPNRRDDGRDGHPIMPWEAERDLKNELFDARYLIYDDWDEDYHVNWSESCEVLSEEVWYPHELARFEKYPAQCTEKDESALKELLGKLNVTWHGGASQLEAS